MSETNQKLREALERIEPWAQASEVWAEKAMKEGDLHSTAPKDNAILNAIKVLANEIILLKGGQDGEEG